jgi:hypothetical protein
MISPDQENPMAFNLHIIHTTDFVRLDGRGKPDLSESRKALEGVAKACIERGANAALIDLRHLQGHLTLADLYQLIRAFHDMGFRHEQRLALLHSYSGAQNADFFALCVSDQGWHVRSFNEFEEAMEWFAKELPVA